MKCPYREFKDCIVEQCPSCDCGEVKKEVVEGRYLHYMDEERALKEGYAWRSTETTYKFVSCKLIGNNVQPVPANKQVINNTTKTNAVVKKSIF